MRHKDEECAWCHVEYCPSKHKIRFCSDRCLAAYKLYIINGYPKSGVTTCAAHNSKDCQKCL